MNQPAPPGRGGIRSPIARQLIVAILAVIASVTPPGPSRAEVPVVAAASSLQAAMTEIAEAYRSATGRAVRLTFGSSGNFTRQIRQGAPFALFLSADEDFVLALAREGLARDEGVVYAVGRLALVVPEGSPLKADGTLDDLAAALADGRLGRFAIANPEHAPYGRRAEEALRHRGLWDALAPHMVLGENVSQAAQFVVSANADGGIIAHSLALTRQVAARARVALIPQDWHQPLRQRMALIKGAGADARAFFDFVQGPAARAIFGRYGFAPPSGG